MNSDTNGTGTLPAPRSYMTLDGRLVQVRRESRVSAYRYWWSVAGDTRRIMAGERPEYITFTYEQDRDLRRTWGA
jgi:hypothetical protein